MVHLHPGVLPPGLEGKPGKTLADFLHWACVAQASLELALLVSQLR